MAARSSAKDPARVPGEPHRRLLTALVCAAVEPGLPGVLLFDLPPDLVAPVTEVFAGLLGRTAGHPGRTAGDSGAPAVPRTTLGAATRDEDLWVRPRLTRGPDGIRFSLAPGPLTESAAGPSLVVVPDLARLSVSGTRATVQLLGADAATVEHSGLRRRWQPRARWLAVCRAEDTERVSPHLLDRFPVRLSVAGLWSLPATEPLGPLPGTWRTALDRAAALPADRPALTLADELAPRVLELLGPDAGHRRALALARIARALTRLDGATEVTAARADEAARLIGLPSAPRAPDDGPPVPGTGSGPGTAAPRPPAPLPGPRRTPRRTVRGSEGRHRAPAERPVLAPEPAESIGPGAAPGASAPATPYPEDEAAPLPEFASLRTPWRRTAGPGAARGPVVGVRRSHDLRDLAPVRTAMEAAKYQAVRGRPDRLAIAPSDLRGYARAPEPERLLTLVLDHTCRAGWNWHDALEPFLQWAYVGRASAQIVEVGSRGAASELRAESFTARSVLDPRIGAALARAPGRATPLAHGLEQAGQALRRAFQHHRAGLVEAWLVVVTDGRGNVPLEASHRGEPAGGPVGRAGIDDALAVAARISGMDRTRLHTVVLDPLRQPYADLPHLLADALGGTVIEGRSTESVSGTGGDGIGR
ncbi:hypothetical protein ACFYYH_03735 [Streptomyces sp. NPDC002018]|uniref:hypothetical protein n=1 Tax=Streptomyces sp. NPDC002018 TaxID=3364629 RepID=UPI00367D3F1C